MKEQGGFQGCWGGQKPGREEEARQQAQFCKQRTKEV